MIVTAHVSQEKAMAPHSSTLAWKIPRMEEPGGLQSMRSRRVRHDWATSLFDSLQPMNCSTPGLPVHHQLPEFTQTYVHWVGDAIQPSHPLLSRVRLLATSWTAAHQAPPSVGFSRQEYWSGLPLPSFIIFWSLLKLISTESVMPFNHLILCHPLLLLPSIFPGIRVFSNYSVLPIRWSSPSSEY